MTNIFGVPVDAVYHLVSGLTGFLTPVLGGVAAVAAIILLTVAVRERLATEVSRASTAANMAPARTAAATAVRPEGLTASWMRSRNSPASTASRLPGTVIASSRALSLRRQPSSATAASRRSTSASSL